MTLQKWQFTHGEILRYPFYICQNSSKDILVTVGTFHGKTPRSSEVIKNFCLVSHIFPSIFRMQRPSHKDSYKIYNFWGSLRNFFLLHTQREILVILFRKTCLKMLIFLILYKIFISKHTTKHTLLGWLILYISNYLPAWTISILYSEKSAKI